MTTPQEQRGIDEQVVDYGDPSLNSTEADIMGAFEDDEQTGETPAPSQDGEGQTQETGEPPAPEGQDTASGGDNEPQGGEGDDGALRRRDGTVVAESGKERREFIEQRKEERATRQLALARQELETLRKQVDDSRVLNDMPKQLGLETNEVQAGLQIMSQFKQDPMAVAKWALQETLSMGYNLSQIVGEGQDSVEMRAIRKMIDDRVGPVVDQQRTTAQEQEARQAAMREYNTFMAQHEHADVHEDALAQLLERDSSLTPSSAYWRLREFATRQGLDFAQPLGPQLREKMQQGRQQQAPAQQAPASAPPSTPAQQPVTAPMPNGASPLTPQQSAEPTYADPNDDWESIIAASMRSAGMR